MYMDEAKEQMQNALVHLENELAKIRAGKANPKILNDVLVDYYGSPTPLSQVANITAPDPRTIAVQPWEKNMLGPIQKAIMNANLGFNPDNNGEVVRINVPPLTAERRKELVKQSKGVGETAKVSIRNARRDAIDEFKKMVKSGLPEDEAKDAEDEVQKITDSYNKKIDEILTAKEKELMVYAVWLMTMESGIRFLTDYLEGDHYFKVHREGHNLDRCRTQFKLVKEMEEKLSEMKAIVQKYK